MSSSPTTIYVRHWSPMVRQPSRCLQDAAASQQTAQQLLSALAGHLSRAGQRSEVSAALLRKARCLSCELLHGSHWIACNAGLVGSEAGHPNLSRPFNEVNLATVLLQALMQLLQRLIHATPHAVVAMTAALAHESDVTLATLREACDGVGSVIDDARRTATSLAGDVRARCAASRNTAEMAALSCWQGTHC